MKKITPHLFFWIACALMVLATLNSCERKPKFFINGIGYYTKTRCLESKIEHKFGYRYGYSFSGKYEYSLGHYTEITCIKSTIDTIQVK